MYILSDLSSTSNKLLYIKLLFYVFSVNFKLCSLIILAASLGFIVKIFDPGL